MADTTFTITFNKNNSSASGSMSTQSVSADATQLTTNAFTYAGHAFNKWNSASDGTGTSFTNKQAVDLDDLDAIDEEGAVTLYAQWNPITYNISYILPTFAKNYANAPTSFNTDSEDITLGTPLFPNKIFLGWYTEAAFTNKVTAIDCSAATGDVKLYAKFGDVKFTPTLSEVKYVTHIVEYNSSTNVPTIKLTLEVSSGYNLVTGNTTITSGATKSAFNSIGNRQYIVTLTSVTSDTIVYSASASAENTAPYVAIERELQGYLDVQIQSIVSLTNDDAAFEDYSFYSFEVVGHKLIVVLKKDA